MRTYDEFNRLSGINYNNATAYAYDPYGNRYPKLTQGSGNSPTLSFDGNNQLTAAAGYTYDAAGNVRTDPNDNYTYDAEGNVVTVTGTNMNAGTNATYYYDAMNHRVRETITGTNASDTDYTFNTDGQRVGSWSATGTPTLLAAYAYWNGQPVTTYSVSGSSTSTFYSHQDLLGTKRMVTNSTGTAVGNFQSFAFGDGFKLSGTDPDAAHFAQLDHDAESDTEHAQFRQYGSTQAAWMSPDPYDGSYDFTNPQSFNRYTYVLNNPLAATDPTGLYQFCFNVRDGGSVSIEVNGNTTVYPTYKQICLDVGPPIVQFPLISIPMIPSILYGLGSSGGNSGGGFGFTASNHPGAPSNNQQPKSPARNQCEANAAASLDKVGSEKVSWSAVKAQLPHDIIEGAVVGAAAGCAAGAAATSWTGPGAAAGCGAGAVDGAGWGALWGGALTFGRAIYDGTSGLIAYHNAMNACAAIP